MRYLVVSASCIHEAFLLFRAQLWDHIDGVRFVIDTGKAKKMRYSHLLRSMCLREEDVSKASTKQRKGRAGRTQTGWAYYLFSQKDHERMNDVRTDHFPARCALFS